MFPNLAYHGDHERDLINPTGIEQRFLMLLSEAEFNRDELGQLRPLNGGPARPFSRMASEMLRDNANCRDLFMEGK